MFQKKKDKRSIQSSKWIYDSLKELMQEKNYKDITVVDIVNKANIGRSTFYRNFENIDHVLISKCEEVFADFRKYCFEYYSCNSHQDKTFLKPFLRYWYTNSEIIELLIKASKENIIKEYLSKEIHFFLSMTSIKENDILSSYLNYFIEMRVSNSLSILTEWVKNNKNIPPDELAEIINSQVTESIKLNLMF